MDTDGRQTGYDLEMLRAITSEVSIPVIASGGAGGLNHLYDVLDAADVDAVLAASIFHFGKYRISEAKAYLAERGVPVRPIEG
jgi:cyclase